MTHIQAEFSKIEKERGWDTLFRKLLNDHNMKTLGKTNDIALLNRNRALNRFRDVLPYDDTRVRLTRGLNDYINASYVQVVDAHRKYILTQGPLPTTSNHFWEMVWEQNSRVIVMLTGLIEKGRTKCHLYYPDYENESELIFDDVNLKVTFVSERQYRHYTQRKFQLENLLTGETRPIIHWSDFEWPDHGAPSNPEPFLHLLADIRRSGAFDSRYGPPILHCSAGIGRSGTFVFVDSILKMLAKTKNSNNISINDVLGDIRTQRHGLIQTVEQFRFSYLAIIAGLKNLHDIEESEQPFREVIFDSSSESETQDDDMNVSNRKFRVECGRQDNIMPSGRLSVAFDDINCELMKRVDSNISNYQLSPQTTHRFSSVSKSNLSSEDLQRSSRSTSIVTSSDLETQSRHRHEFLKRNEYSDKSINDINRKFSRSSSPLSTNDTSLFYFLPSKYRRPLFVGILTLFTGSLLIYKYFPKTNDHR